MNSCPPHPGEALGNEILPALGITAMQAATQLGIAINAMSQVLDGSAPISREMAQQLEEWLGVEHGSVKTWVAQQEAYDSWQAIPRDAYPEPKQHHRDWREFIEERLTDDYWPVQDALLLLANLWPVGVEICETEMRSHRYGLLEPPIVLPAKMLHHDCMFHMNDHYERLSVQASRRFGAIRRKWLSSLHEGTHFTPEFFMSWAKGKGYTPCWIGLWNSAPAIPTENTYTAPMTNTGAKPDELTLELDSIFRSFLTPNARVYAKGMTPKKVMRLLRERIVLGVASCIKMSLADGVMWADDIGNEHHLTLEKLEDKIHHLRQLNRAAAS